MCSCTSDFLISRPAYSTTWLGMGPTHDSELILRHRWPGSAWEANIADTLPPRHRDFEQVDRVGRVFGRHHEEAVRDKRVRFREPVGYAVGAALTPRAFGWRNVLLSRAQRIDMSSRRAASPPAWTDAALVAPAFGDDCEVLAGSDLRTRGGPGGATDRVSRCGRGGGISFRHGRPWPRTGWRAPPCLSSRCRAPQTRRRCTCVFYQ